MASQQAYPATTQQSSPVPPSTGSTTTAYPWDVFVGGYEVTETRTLDITDCLTVEIA